MEKNGDAGCDVVYAKPSVVPALEVSIVKNESGTNSDQIGHDWDAATGVVGFYCRIVHNHYYLVTLVWLCVCIAMSAVVLFGPADERCVGPNAAPGQMQVCR
jgi:hypothetical protein